MASKRQRTADGTPKAVLDYEGTASFRARLVLSCLSTKPVRITNIRPNEESPGLSSFEASFVRLLDKLTNGTHVEINETGTSLFFRPGLVIGGSLEHDCGGDQQRQGGARSAGWFLEGILPLAPFAKLPVNLRLVNCVTNDNVDPSIDFLKEVTIPMLRGFGIGNTAETSAQLDIAFKVRGALPLGGGVVEFRCPVVRALRPIDWVSPGLVKRVRGVAYSTKVSPQVANRAVHTARGVLNNLLPDVYVFTDVYSGKTSGLSPGFALLLTAETTAGATVGAECSADGAALPEDVANAATAALLEEIASGGCVDACSQSLALTLMAMSPEDVTRLRTGPLQASAMATLRLLRDFLGVTFKVKNDHDGGEIGGDTVLLSCLGSGYKNVARRAT